MATKHEEDTSRFFYENGAPASLAQEKPALATFVDASVAEGCKLVCITSGGTTVPLEKNTVRFLDNFSTGNRGAICAEEFLKAGYYVVFLSRKKSASPFARSLQEHLSPTFDLEFMKMVTQVDDNTLQIDLKSCEEEHRSQVIAAVTNHAKFKKRLLNIPFVTLGEYLHKLKAVAEVVGNRHALFVLAAAVSDFYIPDKKMITHKIQSREGPLQLELDQVPKALGVLRKNWAPASMFVSFKLETDHDILIKKAKGSIEKYGMHCVVANELHSRYEQVFLVTAEDEIKVTRGDAVAIESKLVDALTSLHEKFDHSSAK